MTNETPERELYRLLSLRERAWGSGNAGEFQACESRVAQFRARYQKHLETRATVLRGVLKRQAELVARVQTGHLSPDQANAENRRLLAAVEEQRAEIARYNRLLKAQTPKDLGDIDETSQETIAAAPPQQPPAPVNAWFAPREQRQIAVAAVILVVAVLATAYWLVWRNSVRFEITAADGLSGALRVVCTNGTMREIKLRIPRGETPGEDIFGVDVYVHTKDEEEYRLVFMLDECWGHFEASTTHAEPVVIAPGLFFETGLDLACLAKRFPKMDSVRLVCTRGNGKPVYRFTYP